MPGIGIISNPFAKINKRDPEHNTLMWYILGNRGQFEVTNSLSHLSQVCQEFCNRDIDIVGIVGGDGTISLTLSALQKAYAGKTLPRIMILRGGTVNVVASNLGIFGKPKDVMADFIDAFHNNKPLAEMKLHTLKVNGQLGFIFANGLACRFLQEFYKNKTNATGAGLFVARIFADGLLGGKITGEFKKLVQPESIAIQLNHPSIESAQESTDNYSLIFASSIPKLPFGYHLFKGFSTLKSEAEMILIRATGGELVRQASRIFTGQKFNPKTVSHALFDKATLQTEPGQFYSVDGEILQALDGKIEIEMGPAFVFCSPYGNVLSQHQGALHSGVPPS